MPFKKSYSLMRLFLFFALLIIAETLFIAGCKSKQSSEEEQYESKKKSLAYKAYQTSSATLIKASVVTYNLKSPDSLKIDEGTMRLLLAYNWAVMNKPSFALAEANMLEEKYKKDTSIIKAIPLVRSIAFYESGWPGLAKVESDKGMKYMGLNPKDTIDREKVMLFHLLMASVCIKEKQYDAAEFHINGFSLVANIPWLATLVSGMNDIKKNNIKAGLQKIKTVSQDEAVPENLRTELKSAIAEVEAKGGDIDSSLFWPKMMGSLIMDQLSKSADSYLSPLVNTVQRVADTIKDKIPSF